MSAVTAPLLSNMEHNYATDMVRCLICNTLRTRGAEYSGLVDAVGPECSVDACLSAVLRLPLLSLVDHGAVVCSVCFQLLQEIFSLDLRVRTLRRSVRTNFAETYRGVAQRQQQTGAESGDPAAEVLRRLEEADAEDKRGFLSSGTVNGGCKRCDQGKADAVVSRLKNEHLKEPIIEVQVIQVGRPAKRTRRIQTDSSTLDVSAQGEQSASVAPVAPSDASDPPSAAESPPRAESPPPSEGDSSAPPPAAALPSISGDEVADDPGDSGSADRLAPAPGRVLRRRPRRRRSPSPFGPLQENDERDNSGIDPITEGHQCEACGTECSDAAELSRHRDVCTPPPLWSCALCGRAFRHLPQLKRHTRQHQLPTRQLSICLKCGVVYPSEAALAEHTASHPPDAADIRICGFCGLGFWSEPELTAHSAAHTVTCTVCHKQLRKDSLREHMRRHTGETPYGCEECGKRFVAFSSLRAHRRTHTGDKPHKCHLCPEMFHLKQSLVEHLERHENKTLRCEVCGREFPSSRRLAAHAKTHDKRRWQPHTCEFCGDGFMTKRSLRAHRARHTGALPFTCDVCGKGFTYEDTYKEHLSVHSGQRPYTCEVCGKSYGRRSCLWAHRNQHTNPGRFSCSHCGKHFTSQSAFNVHMRIHTGERPYRCPSCSASFRLLSSLKRHTETCGSGIPCPPPAAPAPAPAAPVAAAPIQLQLCMPTGGTAQIEMPAVPPPYSVAWPPPAPADSGGGGGGVVTGLSLPDAERL